MTLHHLNPLTRVSFQAPQPLPIQRLLLTSNMDLKNIINKGGSAAANAQLQQQLAQQTQRTHMSEGAPPGAIPHHLQDAKFNPNQPLHALSNAAHAQTYAQGMMMQNNQFSQQQPQAPMDNGFQTHQPQDPIAAGQSPNGSGTGEVKQQVKAFACSTCGKGFARRSDLARHGKPDARFKKRTKS